MSSSPSLCLLLRGGKLDTLVSLDASCCLSGVYSSLLSQKDEPCKITMLLLCLCVLHMCTYTFKQCKLTLSFDFWTLV